MPAKKRAKSKKVVAKKATSSPKVEPKMEKNPIVLLSKTISLGVVIITLSFLIFGTSAEVVFSIPISMGLVLLGIVFAILVNRQMKGE